MDERTKRAFKDQLYEQFARLGKALANGRRLELLDVLAQGERGVEELAAETALSVANASQHLQILRAAGLVTSRRAGVSVRYQLADEHVVRAWLAVRELGEARLAEVERLVATYLRERQALEPIDVAELRQRLADNSVVLLDVRPDLEHQAGHIPGARSIPITELVARLAEIPRDRDIVAYCRGPYCVFADEAVRELRQRGYRAWRLAVGLPEWRAAGLPVTTASGGTP